MPVAPLLNHGGVGVICSGNMTRRSKGAGVVNGRGARRVRDPDVRVAARTRAATDEHIPASDWEPPATYARDWRKWTLEHYEQVRDPVLREALRRHAQSIRMLNRAMNDEELSRNALTARAGVSTAGAGQVFRGEVWPQVTVMLRLCSAAGLPFGTGQGFVQPDRVDPVVQSLRDRIHIAGMPLTDFAAAAGLSPDALLRIVATAQDIRVEAAGRVADVLDETLHPRQGTLNF